MVLSGQQQLSRRFVKPTFEEIGGAHREYGHTHMLARAQAQRGLEMLDREIGLAGEAPENAAQMPTARVARVEFEGAVDQPHHGPDILAEYSRHEAALAEAARALLPPLP